MDSLKLFHSNTAFAFCLVSISSNFFISDLTESNPISDLVRTDSSKRKRGTGII